VGQKLFLVDIKFFPDIYVEETVFRDVQISDLLRAKPFVTGLITKFCDVWSPKHMTLHMTVISSTFKLLLHCCWLYKLIRLTQSQSVFYKDPNKLLLNKRPEELSIICYYLFGVPYYTFNA
jgi:hypothetical protein